MKREKKTLAAVNTKRAVKKNCWFKMSDGGHFSFKIS